VPRTDGRRPQSRRLSWTRFATGAVAAVVTIGILVLVVSHKDSQFPKAQSCPSASRINTALGTRVAAPTAASDDALIGCFYRQGADGQAVSVSFSVRALFHDPCRTRVHIEVAGSEACRVTGISGTGTSGPSLVVEKGKLQYQFSSDLGRISVSRLEGLAVTVLSLPPPPVQTGDAISPAPLSVSPWSCPNQRSQRLGPCL
jgi:hypothetical protein